MIETLTHTAVTPPVRITIGLSGWHTHLGLSVVLWVKVHIVKDDGIRGGKIDAQTASARAEEEHRDAKVRAEGVDQRLPLGNRCRTVQTAELEPHRVLQENLYVHVIGPAR